MSSDKITVTPVNGRLPTLCFGLAWDPLRLDPTIAAQRKGLRAEQIKGLRDKPDMANALLRHPSEFADLDALVFYFNGKEPAGHISGIIEQALDGALAHTGDDRTGEGDGWDELIVLNLEILPPAITALALMIDSAGGHPLENVPGVRASLQLAQTQKTLLSLQGRPAPGATTCLLALLQREGSGFTVTPVGKYLTVDSIDGLAQWWREYL
jgi:stress response protein SCP2